MNTDVTFQVYAHPEADLRELEAHPARGSVLDLIARLADPDLLGVEPGYPNRRVTGTCRICCQLRLLTFEHLPPRAAGNSVRARGAPAARMLQDETIEFPSNGWTDAQRGVGAHVLCGPCNSHCGLHLVPEYAVLANVVTDALPQLAVYDPEKGLGLPGTVDLSLPGFALGNVARQAIAMLLGASGGAAVARLYPELPRLVAGEMLEKPPGVRLGLALCPDGGRIRLAPPHAVLQPGSASMFVEVAAPPFRWTLSWPGEHLVLPDGVTDVTDWLALSLDETTDIQVALKVGMVVGAAPGDTRDLAAIEAELPKCPAGDDA